jgi:hypothetical protein
MYNVFLLQVERNNYGKICPQVVGTDTFISVIEQTSPLQIFQLIPCKHPISKLTITHDQLDAHGSLTGIVAGVKWRHLT